MVTITQKKKKAGKRKIINYDGSITENEKKQSS
jgi:hypothetical protein